jgi:hypothetical protein
VGFTRMGNDLDAERRSGVAAFGFGLEGFSDGGGGVTWVDNLRLSEQGAGHAGRAPCALQYWWPMKLSFTCRRAKVAIVI